MGIPFGPVGRASDTWHALDAVVDVDLEVGPTHGSLAVNPRHRPHLVHWMLIAHQPAFAVEHAPIRKGSKRLGTDSLDKLQFIRDYSRSISSQTPVKLDPSIRTHGGEESGGGGIIHDKGKSTIKVLHDLIGGVRPSVPKSPVSLDHQHGLVGGLGCQPILLDQRTQIVKAAFEQTVNILVPYKQQPLERVGRGGRGVSEGGGVAEADGVSGFGRVGGEEVKESFLRELGLLGTLGGDWAVELLRRVCKCLLKYTQHLSFATDLGLLRTSEHGIGMEEG